MNRLTRIPTLRVSPDRSIGFTYRGKKQRGLVGDTVATALFANGVRIFSRSLKYHRPRGLYSMGGESSNCMVAVDGVPNVRAETTFLAEGMAVAPQNVRQNVRWSPDFDPMGFMDHLDRAMPAGFFYRMFHKPRAAWPFFLKRIRKMAGTGRISPDFRMAGRYDERYLHADVCVIGGGAAGIHAALAAVEKGLRVVLLESRPWFGGVFDHRAAEDVDGTPLWTRARDLAGRLPAAAGGGRLRIFPHTTAVGCYTDHLTTAVQRGGEADPFDERYLEIRTRTTVVATGCIERPLLFAHNERPGVMQPTCAHRMVRTYGLLPGQGAVFAVGHDLGLEAAADLADLGLDVRAVADCRYDGQDPALTAALADRGIPFLRGWTAAEAHGAKGVRKATLKSVDGTRSRTLACDVVAASAGMTPVTGPLTLAGAGLSYDLHTGFFLPETLPGGLFAAGRLLGLEDPGSVEASGRLAGLRAALHCEAAAAAEVEAAIGALADLPGPVRGSKLVQAPAGPRKTFVCFDEDATVKHVDQACDMGFDAVELAKRFTAAGTGPGQGGIPGHNLPLVIAQYHGGADVETPSTVRPPLAPTLLATYAGAHHDMVKRTPAHGLQRRAGGVFRRIGVWERARYFSADPASREEIEAVRANVGLIDVSTLGKFRLFGPDAEQVLQRVYVSDMSRIADGRAKYSAMVNPDGCLVDDGVVVRQGENDYYFTTSTGRAGMTAEWIRYHTRYDDWNFAVVNLTDAFGAINLAGPNARGVLEKLTQADLSNTAFPFMGYRTFRLMDRIPVRAFRLGFVGELSYELHVPASYMETAWKLILAAGDEAGIRPFGLEAQNVLRLEKGHVIIGQESEIRTTLHDLGLGFLWSRDKSWAGTVGEAALRHTEKQPGRIKLAGFRMEDPERAPKDGSIIVDEAIRGHVCTARYSHTLGEAVGLALVAEELSAEGTRLAIFEDGMGADERLHATVSPPPFYDPEGGRLRM